MANNHNNIILKNVRFIEYGFEHWPMSKYLEVDIFDDHENRDKILAWLKTNNIKNIITTYPKRTLYRNNGLIGGFKLGMKSSAKVFYPNGRRFALRKLKKGTHIDVYIKPSPTVRKQKPNSKRIGIVTKIIAHENNTNSQHNQ